MKIGELIPEFHVPDQDCNYLSTSDLIGEPLVIYFYPKDDTPGCTKQACSFRDRYSEFENAGAKVIGVSSDSPEDHREFQSHSQFSLGLRIRGQRTPCRCRASDCCRSPSPP